MSQQAIPLSAVAKLSKANIRALSWRLLFCASPTSCAIRFQCPGGVEVPPPSAQKRAMFV